MGAMLSITQIAHRLDTAIAALIFGFLGIGVALVGRLNPLLIIPSAAAFAILRVGSNSLQAAAGLTPSVGEVIVAVLVITLMVTGVIRFLYPESADAH